MKAFAVILLLLVQACTYALRPIEPEEELDIRIVAPRPSDYLVVVKGDGGILEHKVPENGLLTVTIPETPPICDVYFIFIKIGGARRWKLTVLEGDRRVMKILVDKLLEMLKSEDGYVVVDLR